MKRLIILLLVSAVAKPALADDLVPAPWANDGDNNRTGSFPSTTFSEWIYDDQCGVYSFDTPQKSWFVSHPHKVDPEMRGCESHSLLLVIWHGSPSTLTSVNKKIAISVYISKLKDYTLETK